MDNKFVQPQTKTNAFATTSMCLGIASLTCGSILFLLLGIFSIPLTGMAILFSILSKDSMLGYHLHAKVGFLTGGIGIFISILLFTISIISILLSPKF